jgi:quercetin dioxygenase-like cupin family protein
MTAANDKLDDTALEAQVFDLLAAAVKPAAIEPARRDALRERLRARIAPPPEGTTTFRPADAGWFSPATNVEMKMLRLDEAAGTSEMLIRLGPGVQVPAHSHRKEEQMVILEGECHLGEHLLRAGDTHVAPPGSWHPPITVERGVLMLLRSEYPLPAG